MIHVVRDDKFHHSLYQAITLSELTPIAITDRFIPSFELAGLL